MSYIKIKVKRFPHSGFPIKVWGNHEKVIIIDEEIAYIGGIDLFWGRYDTEEYIINEESNKEKHYMWPGIDYSNDRLYERKDVRNYLIDYIDRDSTSRMPWHDVSVKLQGPVVIDVLRHFSQRWIYSMYKKLNYPPNFGTMIHNI